MANMLADVRYFSNIMEVIYDMSYVIYNINAVLYYMLYINSFVTHLLRIYGI